MVEEEVEEEIVVPVKKREVAAATAADDEGFSSVGKGGKTVIAVSQETLLTRLREVLESRGKKVKSKSNCIMERKGENAHSFLL